MSHLKLHFALHTPHYTLHTPHFTLHIALFALDTSHSTLHSPHFSLLTAFFTLHTSHLTLHTSHFTLHTALFTPHTSHCTLHTPHFISSELFSPYPSSSLLISSLLICHRSFHESLPSTTSRTCMRRAPARPVRVCFVRSCCSVVVQEHGLRATRVQCNVKQTLSSHFTLHTPRSTLHTCTLSQLISSELFSSHFVSSHMSAKFFLAIFLSSERSSTYLISPKLGSTHLGSMESSVNNLSEAYDHLKISFPTRSGRHTSILLILENRLQRLSWKTQKNYVQQRLQLQLQNRSSTPQRKKDDFEALFKRTFKRKITSAKIEKICWQITVAALMQPLQY